MCEQPCNDFYRILTHLRKIVPLYWFLINDGQWFIVAFRDPVISRQLMIRLRRLDPAIYLITVILHLFHQQRFSKIVRDSVIT